MKAWLKMNQKGKFYLLYLPFTWLILKVENSKISSLN